jgi:hypothetical protein
MAARNLFWEILEPLVTPQAKPSRKPKSAPNPTPRPEVRVPEFREERKGTQGQQLWELRGRNNFRAQLLVDPKIPAGTVHWPDILAQPGVFPGDLMNTLNFQVRQPRDLAPRRFKYLRTLDWEQVFMEEV